MDHRNKQHFKSKLDAVPVLVPVAGHHAKDENRRKRKKSKKVRGVITQIYIMFKTNGTHV